MLEISVWVQLMFVAVRFHDRSWVYVRSVGFVTSQSFEVILGDWMFLCGLILQYDSTQNKAWSRCTCTHEGFWRCASTIWQGQEDGYSWCSQVCTFTLFSSFSGFICFCVIMIIFFCCTSGCWGCKLATSTVCWVVFLLKLGGITMTPSRWLLSPACVLLMFL